MSKKLKKFSPNFRRGAIELLFCQAIEQFCLRLIAKFIFSGSRDCAGVEIVVGQVQLSGACLAQELLVAIQSCVEAGFE